MSHRPFPDPNEILDVAIEPPDWVETAQRIDRGERHLRALARMAEVGLGLVDMLEQIAKTRLDAASHDGAVEPRVDDIAGAYGKITQSLRRTLAMEARLADEMKDRRLGAVAARNAERAQSLANVQELVDENIEYALTKAIRRERPDADREAVENLLTDMFERLGEAEEFEDYHRRPPGETVARLCAAFGLDPEFCVKDDDETWMIRRAPTAGPPTPEVPAPAMDLAGPGAATTQPRPEAAAVCSSP